MLLTTVVSGYRVCNVYGRWCGRALVRSVCVCVSLSARGKCTDRSPLGALCVYAVRARALNTVYCRLSVCVCVCVRQSNTHTHMHTLAAVAHTCMQPHSAQTHQHHRGDRAATTTTTLIITTTKPCVVGELSVRCDVCVCVVRAYIVCILYGCVCVCVLIYIRVW